MISSLASVAGAVVRGFGMRARAFILLLALTGTAFAKTALLEHVRLQWKPTSDLRLGVQEMSQVPIRFEVFQDARDNKEAIGENREDEKPKPVTTTDDVGEFVSAHMRELFANGGLKTVDSNGAVTIKGEVRQFFARETSTYKSEVAVHLTVVDSEGKTLWSGVASGAATRFGRSYKLENYYEVLSDALVNTVSSVLQSAEFQKALGAAK
jgi:hypothetical protein